MYKKYFSRPLLMGNFFSCMIACWFFNKYNNDDKNFNNKNNFNGTLILLTMYGFIIGSLLGIVQNKHSNEYEDWINEYEDWAIKLYQSSSNDKIQVLDRKNDDINKKQYENQNNNFGGFKKGFLLVDSKKKETKKDNQKIDDEIIANKINSIDLQNSQPSTSSYQSNSPKM